MIFTGVSKYGSSMCPKTTNIMRKPFNESSLESLLLWQSTEYPPPFIRAERGKCFLHCC